MSQASYPAVSLGISIQASHTSVSGYQHVAPISTKNRMVPDHYRSWLIWQICYLMRWLDLCGMLLMWLFTCHFKGEGNVAYACIITCMLDSDRILFGYRIYFNFRGVKPSWIALFFLHFLRYISMDHSFFFFFAFALSSQSLPLRREQLSQICHPAVWGQKMTEQTPSSCQSTFRCEEIIQQLHTRGLTTLCWALILLVWHQWS